ncbi:hypothetical protein EMIHUDRAFT_449470 [Emiliania huxleyi CCMP1516]|uniref:Ankyrin repeat protein n=2 Tax=Emiliania huxleyi TaxID=2903 RepID=A0A0D3K8B7_EMIH1|nr:hypothetical protein EMIHUDRAFT_449470 [Emiliania huxleyi CCMP1516]EOD32002.1 hypothetical protein EMIHUDRAFT_449470 [Emiliania huxleyi CCMP1516]|eukprot:XP_005784431.1 hypothetical protein EMIHUDRAFT_449470 [Emiliania huxleyi CCMP1516]
MTDVAAIGQKLLRASAQNDLEQLDSALRGASPDYANGIGQTGLHVASIHGHVEVVKRLLKAGALVSSTNRYGVTPLHYAADSGRIEVARLLIEAGANKRTRASNGKLPVDMIKEDADCAEELQALLGSGSNKLHRAIKGHNLALLRQLLEAGKEDLSAVDSRGRSPFHLAALAAVTSTEDREQFNSSMAALQALVLAAKARGGEDKVRRLCSEDYLDDDGFSPLHVVVHADLVDGAAMLLEAGADPNVQTYPESDSEYRSGQWGRTLADGTKEILSAQSDCSSLHIALGEIGMDNGCIHAAVNAGDVEALALLLRHGADPSAAGKGGWTPLTLAARSGKTSARGGAALAAPGGGRPFTAALGVVNKRAAILRLFGEEA